MRRLLPILLLAWGLLYSHAQDRVTLLFAGDAMQHTPQHAAAWLPKEQRYDYSDCFTYLLPYLQYADLSVANLEVPLAGKPYTGYPRFSAPDEWAKALHNAGFNVLTIANNHVFDKADKGLNSTINTLCADNILFAGAYRDSLQRDTLYPLIVDIESIRIAFLNFTYGTNGIHVTPPCCVNLIDTTQILSDITKARQLGADIIIALPHWGQEYKLKSNRQQQELAHWLLSHHVDAIVGTHPHVVQDAQLIPLDDKVIPIVYSLGNLISNQRWKNSNGGIILSIDISTKTKKIIDVAMMPVYVYKGSLGAGVKYYLIPTSDYIEGNLPFRLPEYAERELRLHHNSTVARLPQLRVIKLSSAVPLKD